MDKTTTLLGALNAGKLPTTQQFDAFVEWVEKDVGLFAAEAVSDAAAAAGGGVEEVRREGEELAEGKSNLSLIGEDVRGLLGAYRAFLNDKNGLLCISSTLSRTNHPAQPITSFRKRYGIFVSSHIPLPLVPLRPLPLAPPMKRRTSPKTSTKPVSQSSNSSLASGNLLPPRFVASELAVAVARASRRSWKTSSPSSARPLQTWRRSWKKELGRLRKG